MKKTSFRYQIWMSILKSGMIALIIAGIASMLIVYPILGQTEKRTIQVLNDAIIQDTDNTLTFVENFSEYTAVAIEQNATIQDYLRNPTNYGKTASSVILNHLASYINLVRGIVVMTEDTPYVDSMTNLTEDDYLVLQTDSFKRVNTSFFGRAFSPIYKTTVSHTEYYTVAYSRNYYQNNRWITVVLYVNLNNLINDVREVADSTLDAYALIDSTGEEYFAAGNSQSRKMMEKAMQAEPETKAFFGGTLFVKTSVVNGFKVVSLVTWMSLLVKLLPYLLGLFCAMLGFMILSFVLTSSTVSHALKPVLDLSDKMLMAAGGNLDCKVESSREDEIGQLEKSYNKMLDDLKNYIDIIGEKEAREQKTKYSLLISQIDPHFICNTINSISYLARKGRYEDVVRVNNALVIILRDRLRVKDIQIMDTIENEVRVIEQYLMIEQQIYGGNLEVEWDVKEELMTEEIPKNMIQPLVENALFHGLIDEESGELKGKLLIGIREDGNHDLILSVSDNGIGMEPDKLLAVRKEEFEPEARGFRIGLANIRGRLYYLYGGDECLTIESAPNMGTTVTITLRNRMRQTIQ